MMEPLEVKKAHSERVKSDHYLASRCAKKNTPFVYIKKTQNYIYIGAGTVRRALRGSKRRSGGRAARPERRAIAICD